MHLDVVLAGATGTIGQAVARELVARGYSVFCPVRPGSAPVQVGLDVSSCRLTEPGSLARALKGRQVDAVISCIASRGGAPRDAWAVEYYAQLNLLTEAAEAGARHFILL
ncbi:MAG: NAD(P)H-binding protein, partial [Pseudomonadota bacterium]